MADAVADAGTPRAANPFLPRIYRVLDVRRELPDTATLRVAPLSGKRPDFLPGQFNMLYAFGVGEVAVSISGPVEDDTQYIHTIRHVGMVSGALARLQPGAEIGLRGPYGTAWPMQEALGADVVVVAGGLGLAPLRPVVYDIMANRGRFGRVSILLGSREPASLLYRHEVEEWRKQLDVDIQITVDHAGTDWHGNVGVVTDLIRRAAFDPADTVAMVCGPEIMMRYAALALADAGVSRQQVYVSMERNMKCAIGLCGHCQFGPTFVCKDGPVMTFDRIAPFFAVREI